MSHTRRYLIAGLMIWIPLGVTILVINMVVDLLDGIFSVLPATADIFPTVDNLATILGSQAVIAVLTLAASARASRIRGTHQDVLVNYVVAVGYGALSDLRESFMEVVR